MARSQGPEVKAQIPMARSPPWDCPGTYFMAGGGGRLLIQSAQWPSRLLAWSTLSLLVTLAHPLALGPTDLPHGTDRLPLSRLPFPHVLSYSGNTTIPPHNVDSLQM